MVVLYLRDAICVPAGAVGAARIENKQMEKTGENMDELFIGEFVGQASVEELQRLLENLEGGGAGTGSEAELLTALRGDPDGLGDYFRLAVDMKLAAHAGR